MSKNLLLFCVAAFLGLQATAASAGDYRTIASGNWSSAAIWQMYNGTHWVNATAAPTDAANIIIIASGDSVTVSDTTYADQLVVNAHATLHVISNILYLKNGAGDDLVVSGKLIIDGLARVADDPVTGGSAVDYRGDTLIQNGGFQVAQTFDGPRPQLILGQGFNADLTINNAGNVTLAGSESYNGATFVKGKILATGTFVMTEYRHTFTGANNAHFIEGNIVLITYSNDALSFILPLGTGTNYTPVVFNVQKNNALQTDYVISINAGAPPSATLPSTLDRVSSSRYISISADQTGIVSSSLQLTYNTLDGVTDPDRLRIAESVAGNWVNLGGKGGATNKIASRVNFTTFGNFVLANAASTILPLNGSATTANINVTDKWKVITDADGQLNLSLTSANTNPLSLHLLDYDGATVLGTLAVSANTTGTLNTDGLAKGTYFVTVAGTNTAAPYSYTLANTLVTPAQAKDAEPNNNTTQATILALSASNTGHIGYYYNTHRDVNDWYKVTTGVNGTLKLTLTSANGNDIHLKLTAGDGTTLLRNLIVNGNSTGTINKTGLAPGTYYIAIRSLDADKFEPYILADTLIPDAPFTGGTIKGGQEESSLKTGNKAGIEDALVYPNPTAKQFRIQLNSIKIDGSVALALKDVNGKTVWSNAKTTVSSLNSLAVDVSTLPNGMYFLQIMGEDKKVITKKIIISR